MELGGLAFVLKFALGVAVFGVDVLCFANIFQFSGALIMFDVFDVRSEKSSQRFHSLYKDSIPPPLPPFP